MKHPERTLLFDELARHYTYLTALRNSFVRATTEGQRRHIAKQMKATRRTIAEIEQELRKANKGK